MIAPQLLGQPQTINLFIRTFKGLKMLSDQILSALFIGETIENIKKMLGLSALEINNALRYTDTVVCPHCHLVSNIGGLVGKSTDDCPKCGYTILKSKGATHD